MVGKDEPDHGFHHRDGAGMVFKLAHAMLTDAPHRVAGNYLRIRLGQDRGSVSG